MQALFELTHVHHTRSQKCLRDRDSRINGYLKRLNPRAHYAGEMWKRNNDWSPKICVRLNMFQALRQASEPGYFTISVSTFRWQFKNNFFFFWTCKDYCQLAPESKNTLELSFFFSASDLFAFLFSESILLFCVFKCLNDLPVLENETINSTTFQVFHDA